MKVHYLAAQWTTFCGIVLDRRPIAPTDDKTRTTAWTPFGRLVTYVRADVTCGRCRRSIAAIYGKDGTAQ